ncbi:MAG TPA: ABC transporter permease [Patescibacteria group bacterium]|nr:ABC transporter permease [Patescibacteria group bacterium]
MRYLQLFYEFLIDVFKSRNIIIELTKKDFRSRYLGSQLGILWAFIQPMMMIAIFWFVFQVGFKSTPVANFPFILWLMAGIIPWFFFSESIASATGSIQEHSFLVKKVVFRVSILPIVKILSALVIHLFFVMVLFVMMLAYGYMPTLYMLQVLYYLIAMIVLVLGISWLTSSLIVFLRDIGHVIGVVLQFGFWLTPIFWSIGYVPEQYRFLIKLNPAFYIIEGYRNSLIYGRWFWEDWRLTLYFWVIAVLFLCFGALLFRRLRPHFADVL